MVAQKMASQRTLWFAVLCGAMLGSCGGAPVRSEPKPTQAAKQPGKRAEVIDDCAVVPGKKPPEALKKRYIGVAAKARCQREVFTIMGGLVHFLGVKCAYCHEEPDYAKMTHRKHVANWMARELIPSLEKRTGSGEIWCNDCHLQQGKGKAKLLGKPRDQRWTVEWMTTHLAEDFQAADRKPLRCKSCHGANLGSPEFRRRIILTDHLPVAKEARRRPLPHWDKLHEAPAPAEGGVSAGDAGASVPADAAGAEAAPDRPPAKAPEPGKPGSPKKDENFGGRD